MSTGGVGPRGVGEWGRKGGGGGGDDGSKRESASEHQRHEGEGEERQRQGAGEVDFEIWVLSPPPGGGVSRLGQE